MELIDILQEIVARYVAGAGMTDLAIGTVTGVGPLEVTVESTRLVLPEAALLLTAAVVEKKLPVLTHRHTTGGLGHDHDYSDGTTDLGLTQDVFPSDDALEGIACIEHGQPLPVVGGYLILNRGLAVGDKVLMLRVQAGQSYLVLSRVFEKGD